MLLNVQNLYYAYQEVGQQQTVLQAVNFTLQCGERVAFLSNRRAIDVMVMPATARNANGKAPQQFPFLVIIQALLMGLLARLLALPLGWSMQHDLAIGQFVQAALLASWYPVWRMAKVSIGLSA